ncbi:hypothetical protein, variant [Blastomyces gilchristii SLH14081]|uniref:Uncharacterized protein n=1 Tax=Blastomyces gilchristii (strain SLH14081) TaxID=559298 RepID=A0A179ULV5_BLAGS|nr:uncharacterized protein BDBG_04182 [Blastomyces gilchristii SLH14081]XP_031578175.1 hypothetical protein, variant [Blastomyces gilchristii SLH14081]OAT08208.1 hypothetical protein BDBG_04182 [Blastomyces gilchristii SLH14081]OAT08209.1 hypothetical protein, variant [Blastomyces gilchristii SLH14081]
MHYRYHQRECNNAGTTTPYHLLEWLQNTASKQGLSSPPGVEVVYSRSKEEYEPVQYRPASPADSAIDIGDSSPPPAKSVSVPPSVLEAREDAKDILNNCHTALLSLELTRMRKSRIGMSSWVAFWQRIYSPELAKVICTTIASAAPKVDKVFQSVAKELFNITYRAAENIKMATTEAQIIQCWQLMEQETIAYRNLRDRYVRAIMEDLRVRIEAIPVDISDELFDDLKRAIFVVDPSGNYHPGDPEAEERDMHSQRRPQAREYIRADPHLVFRPGFSGDFQSALERAAAEDLGMVVEEPDPLELTPSDASATTGEWSASVLSDMGIDIIT